MKTRHDKKANEVEHNAIDTLMAITEEEQDNENLQVLEEDIQLLEKPPSKLGTPAIENEE